LMAAIGWKADGQEWLIEADRKVESTRPGAIAPRPAT